VNTLIKGTNIKYEATTRYYLRYCYSARRTAQNMSASRGFPPLRSTFRGLASRLCPGPSVHLIRCWWHSERNANWL